MTSILRRVLTNGKQVKFICVLYKVCMPENDGQVKLTKYVLVVAVCANLYLHQRKHKNPGYVCAFCQPL